MSLKVAVAKSGVIASVLVVCAASAHYVVTHLKNPAAPLHPAVAPSTPQVALGPLSTTSAPPVTSTYVS